MFLLKVLHIEIDWHILFSDNLCTCHLALEFNI